MRDASTWPLAHLASSEVVSVEGKQEEKAQVCQTGVKISSSRSYGAMKSKNLWPSSLSFLYEGGQERGTAVSVYSQL